MRRLVYAFVLTAVAVLALYACTMKDDGYYWRGYDIRGNEYILYTENVMKRCVSEPLEVLDYVMNISDTLSSAGMALREGAYLLTDKSGTRIGTITCKVSADRDTIWSYGDVSYVVKRLPSPGVEWSIALKETPGGRGRCWFDSVLEVKNVSVGKESAVRHDSEISLSGVRHEESDYLMTFNSGAMKIRWKDPESYFDATIVATGTLNISFRKGDKEKDWLRAEYVSGVTSYQKSF